LFMIHHSDTATALISCWQI